MSNLYNGEAQISSEMDPFGKKANEALKADLAAANQRYTALQSEHTTLGERYSSLEREHGELGEENEKLRESKEALEERLEAAEQVSKRKGEEAEGLLKRRETEANGKRLIELLNAPPKSDEVYQLIPGFKDSPLEYYLGQAQKGFRRPDRLPTFIQQAIEKGMQRYDFNRDLREATWPELGFIFMAPGSRHIMLSTYNVKLKSEDKVELIGRTYTKPDREVAKIPEILVTKIGNVRPVVYINQTNTGDFRLLEVNVDIYVFTNEEYEHETENHTRDLSFDVPNAPEKVKAELMSESSHPTPPDKWAELCEHVGWVHRRNVIGSMMERAFVFGYAVNHWQTRMRNPATAADDDRNVIRLQGTYQLNEHPGILQRMKIALKGAEKSLLTDFLTSP